MIIQFKDGDHTSQFTLDPSTMIVRFNEEDYTVVEVFARDIARQQDLHFCLEFQGVRVHVGSMAEELGT
jgi:hypothetical protein